MDHPLYVIAPILIVLSVVQSVFGVGLLVFGTPTLLLLGYDFAATLGWLLPSSLAISLLQVLGAPSAASGPVRWFIVGLPLLITAGIIHASNTKLSVNLLIGLSMLLVATMRYSTSLAERLTALLKRHETLYLLAMGVLHGATNMGGAMLALYASGISKNKSAIRHVIASYYLFFGVIQLGVLALLHPNALSGYGIAFAAVAAAVFLVVGNRVFQRAGAATYERAFTGFIAAYGVAILVKGLL